MASPTLGRLYPRGKSQILIFQEAEWTPGSVWTRRSEEKCPHLRHPGSNPGRPARTPVPCRLSYLAEVAVFICRKHSKRVAGKKITLYKIKFVKKIFIKIDIMRIKIRLHKNIIEQYYSLIKHWGQSVIGIFGSLIWSKTLMELIFNPCGEFR